MKTEPAKRVQVMCRYCYKLLSDVVAGTHVRWEVCDECKLTDAEIEEIETTLDAENDWRYVYKQDVPFLLTHIDRLRERVEELVGAAAAVLEAVEGPCLCGDNEPGGACPYCDALGNLSTAMSREVEG